MFQQQSWALSAALLLGGCMTDVEGDVCVDAETHVFECTGERPTLGPSCDPALAEELLETPCDTFNDPGKADLVSRAMCRAGLLHVCEVPACESATSTFPDACIDLVEPDGCGQCDYYRCREQTAQCGEGGYYEDFGYRYCNAYASMALDRVSSEGQAWYSRVRRCLIEAAEAQISDDATCEEIQQIAFDSHPQCYLDTGFCELPIRDMFLTLNTVKPDELSFREILITGVGCVEALLADPFE